MSNIWGGSDCTRVCAGLCEFLQLIFNARKAFLSPTITIIYYHLLLLFIIYYLLFISLLLLLLRFNRVRTEVFALAFASFCSSSSTLAMSFFTNASASSTTCNKTPINTRDTADIPTFFVSFMRKSLAPFYLLSGGQKCKKA